jgi:hypothetical protein
VKTITVAAYNSLSEAEPLQKRLQEAGIPAEIHRELTSDKILEFARVNAGVRIEVPRSHFEEALLIMHDWEVEKDAPGIVTASGTVSGTVPPPWVHR